MTSEIKNTLNNIIMVYKKKIIQVKEEKEKKKI